MAGINAIYFVAELSRFPGNRFEKMGEILHWLSEENIIKPEPCTVRYTQDDRLFSDGIRSITKEPWDVEVIPVVGTGLEHITER